MPHGSARTAARGYVLCLAVLAAAVALRWLLDPVLGNSLPLVTMFGAVAVGVWLGGYGAAILAALGGYAICAYLFIEPRGALGLDDTRNVVGLIAYAFTCALIIGFGESLRLANARAAARQEVLRVTLRSIGDAVITTDVAGRVTYLNGVAESLTGWSNEEAAGQLLDTVFRIVNEDTRKPVESPATRALREGIIVGLANHTVLIRKDGSECPIDDSAAPIRNEAGQVSGCVLIFRDVTAHREVERERRNQLSAARRLASIVESSEAGIVGKSLDGTIRSWNAAAERIFGYSAEQAIGRHISLVIPRELRAEEDQIIAALKRGERVDHMETERVRADGERIRVSLTISPIMDDDGNVVGASKIVRDITEERAAAERERALVAERERLALLVENSADFIGFSDPDGTPMYINAAGLRMAGLSGLGAARRLKVWDFFFPEDQPLVREQLFPAVLEHGRGAVEIRFRQFDTGEARWMAFKAFVLPDSAGRPIGFATVSQDITHRKELEEHLRQLAADLSAADRRKDVFLATLAHELRGPLAPLSNVLQVWKRTSDEALRATALETMERQLGQLVRLVEDLLDLNRITHDRLDLRMRRAELAPIVHQAVEACRPLADQMGHRIVVEVPAEPIYVHGDPARLAQVLGNLLNNGCKYTEPGGSITIAAKEEDGEAIVSVRDTGRGIAPDKLSSIFDMFMQVDRSDERSQGGLGIGLTLVKRLVRMHGGSVEAHSAGDGRGSEFIVRLPAATQRPEESSGAAVAAPPSAPLD